MKRCITNSVVGDEGVNNARCRVESRCKATDGDDMDSETERSVKKLNQNTLIFKHDIQSPSPYRHRELPYTLIRRDTVRCLHLLRLSSSPTTEFVIHLLITEFVYTFRPISLRLRHRVRYTFITELERTQPSENPQLTS